MDDRSRPAPQAPARPEPRRIDPLLMMSLGLGVFFVVVLAALALG